MSGNFEEQLARGRRQELLTSEDFQKRGWYVIPSYDYTGDEANKAPKLLGELCGFAVPDLDISKDGKRLWVEVKSKSSATFYRKLQRDEHGIPLRLYRDYLRVQEETGCPVWLFIIEEDTGQRLCESLNKLGEPRIYDGDKMSRGGMAFWPRDKFKVYEQ